MKGSSSSVKKKSTSSAATASSTQRRRGKGAQSAPHANSRPHASYASYNSGSNHNSLQCIDRIISTESLLATDSEKCATSRSLYGDSYARISSNVNHIHDSIRLRAYEAIFRSVSGKTVLQLGCGFGLYAMLAARHMAKQVVAIDTSAIVDAARTVATQNRLHNITFLRGRLCDVLPQLPCRSFDIIMCEWMGVMLLNDKMLADVLYARDHLLNPDGGLICPNRSSLHVLGVSDYTFRLNTEDFWSNVYGFTMHPMKELVRREVEVCSVPACNVVTDTCLTHTVDIDTLPGLTPEECARYESMGSMACADNGDESKTKQTHAAHCAASLSNGNGNEEEQAKKTTTDEEENSSTSEGGAEDNPVAQRWVPSLTAQRGFSAPFSLVATRATTINYLTFYIDAMFTSRVDCGANFVIGIKPGGHNAWTEVSVGLHEALPVMCGETITGTIRAVTPASDGGRTTVVSVTARTEGKVAAVETSGEYVYVAY